MEKQIQIKRGLLLDTMATLQEYLLLLEEGIEQPSKPTQIQKIKTTMAQLTKVGNFA
jgi:hypothetical protein